MPKFLKSLRDWQSDSFAQSLKSEIESLETGSLPLDKGVSQGGYVDDSNIAVTVLSITDAGHAVWATVGVFFTEIIAGCSCGDDPMPQNAYCKLQVRIDKSTAETEFTVITD